MSILNYVLHARFVQGCIYASIVGVSYYVGSPIEYSLTVALLLELALLLYDYILTLDCEVRLFWPQGPRLSRLVFFLLRITVIGTAITRAMVLADIPERGLSVSD